MDSCECQDAPKKSEEMGAPHITTFCWCMGLETGARLIGYLHLMTSLSLTVVCALFAEAARERAGSADDADGVYSASYAIAASVAALSVVHVLLALTLIVSVHKRWAGGARAWAGVMLALAACALLYVAGAAAGGFSAAGSDIFLAFLQGLLFFGFVGYCILCVYSYHLKLKSTEDMQGPVCY